MEEAARAMCRANFAYLPLAHMCPRLQEILDLKPILGQPHMAVFKGEGGEIERRPEKPVFVESLHAGEARDEEWPTLLSAEANAADAAMDLGRLLAVWRGTEEDPYAVAAITGTAAIALRLLGRADDVGQATALAREMWETRERRRLGGAA